jgi:hypothetical protein
MVEQKMPFSGRYRTSHSPEADATEYRSKGITGLDGRMLLEILAAATENGIN